MFGQFNKLEFVGTCERSPVADPDVIGQRRAVVRG